MDTEDLNARAAHTLHRVRSEMESQKQLPLVSQLVRLIKDISGRPEQMSIDELVEAISAEPTTLARVMSVASKMVYNPGGSEITSLHQAVLAVGFEHVRHLAISILLLENAQSEFSAEANRGLAGTALVSGLTATALSCRIPGMDPDLAFVCGALRTYGHMLVATFMAEDYSSMLHRCSGSCSEEQFQNVFGLTSVALGREILTNQQLPNAILETMVDLEGETRKQTEQTPGLALAEVADLSLRITETLQKPDLTNENFVSLLEDLSGKYSRSLLLGETSIRDLVTQVSLTLATFSSQTGVSLDSFALFRRLDCLAHSRPLPPPFKATGKTSPPAVAPSTKAAGPDLPPRDERTLQAAKSLEVCIESITRLVRELHPDPRRIFELLLQTLHQTLNLSNCLIFIKHRQSGLFRVTRGIGPLMNFARDTVALDPEIPTLFSEAIKQGRDILIRNGNEPSVRGVVPEWLCPSDQTIPILLLPVKTSLGTFALVCATCRDAQAFDLAEKLRPELGLLRKQVALVGDFLT